MKKLKIQIDYDILTVTIKKRPDGETFSIVGFTPNSSVMTTLAHLKPALEEFAQILLYANGIQVSDTNISNLCEQIRGNLTQ